MLLYYYIKKKIAVCQWSSRIHHNPSNPPNYYDIWGICQNYWLKLDMQRQCGQFMLVKRLQELVVLHLEKLLDVLEATRGMLSCSSHYCGSYKPSVLLPHICVVLKDVPYRAKTLILHFFVCHYYQLQTRRKKQREREKKKLTG